MVRVYERKCLRSLLLALTVGCSPINGGPPPVALPDDFRQDFGVNHTTVPLPDSIGIEDALYYRRAVGERSELHVTGGFVLGYSIFPYTMFGYRRYLIDRPGRTLGLEVQLSPPIFAEVAVPMAFQLPGRSLFLTAHPSVGLTYMGVVNLPVGLTWQPRPRLQIHNALGARLGGNNYAYWSTGVSVPF